MDLFPHVDPIPLPAPVWLFKLLHIVTLVLHFYAVHFLVGGLMVAAVWAILGRRRNNAAMQDAADQITHRLPIVMTFVINFGVPPLLFAQVLYGRALYTSSVLIGFWWISVIFLVMFTYTMIYVMVKRSEKGRAFGWAAVIALVAAMKIGMIYSSNMTLMLRPDAWGPMYSASGSGIYLPGGDPTIVPRWLYMILGSAGVTGLALLLLPTRLPSDAPAAKLLRKAGGRLIAIFTVVQIAFGFVVFSVQPDAVRAGLIENRVYVVAIAAWGATALALVPLGWIASRGSRLTLPAALCGISFVNILAMTVVRDGIRDVTLSTNGFDVWNRAVATNWSTVLLFLLLFVVAVGTVGWLAKVLITAQTRSPHYG